MNTLKQLLHEYDANTEIVNNLRKSCRIDPSTENLQNLGAHLIWRSSLRIQILQIYFKNL